MTKTVWKTLFAVIILSAGCATNPVTGKRELHLVSEQQEIQIGQQQYVPSQQMQGGQYDVDPALSRYVNEVGQRLVKVSDRPELPFEFVVLNNNVPNAWALPGGKIAVNRGLLTKLNSEAELAAVLGHEIVHAAARHGAKSMERGMLLQAGVSVLGVVTANRNWANLAVGGAALGASLISTKYGRDAELEADEYGIKYMVKAGYDPRASIALQETFVRLFEGRQQNWLDGLFASHPPSQDRVAANRVTVGKYQMANPFVGQKEYQQRLAGLVKDEPAYEKYEQGLAALKDKQYDKAANLADEAIRRQPREALFYGLKGDAHLQQKQAKAAIQDYNEAIKLNNDYFEYYLMRGIAQRQLNDRAAARVDLERSVKILPTALGHFELGNLAAAVKDEGRAIEHYRVAAESESEVGKEATLALVRLDLPRNPASYIEVRQGLGSRGEFIVQLGNKTPVAVKGVVLTLSGAVQRQIAIGDTIAPGTAKQVVITLPPGVAPQGVRVQLTQAQLAN